MLADRPSFLGSFGTLSRNIHFENSQRFALLKFVENSLPRWRDDRQRPSKTAETVLTSQLCSFLNSATNHSPWDFVQFKVEEPDEENAGRKVDLVANPKDAIVWASGRRCTHYDTLLPIECKRLPTPKGKDRDDREYVTSGTKTVGGIQRFKLGFHASNHDVAGMIAFIQDGTHDHWMQRVNGWITDLAEDTSSGWSATDQIEQLQPCDTGGLSTFKSRHRRDTKKNDIEIRHMWIRMSGD